MYLFLAATPIALAMKIYCLGYIIYSPGSNVTSFLLAQTIIIVVADFFVAIMLVVCGWSLLRSFGKGLRQLLLTSDESLIRRPFI